MRFASVRDFRVNASAFLRRGGAEAVVVTLRGKPVGLFVPVEEDQIEMMTQAVKSVRLKACVEALRERARRTGANRLKAADIEAEIRAVRRARRGD